MSKATGVSMQGSKGYRIDKGKVRADCRKCSYRRTRGAISYCDYYDIFSPNKKYCIRYHGPKVTDAKVRSNYKIKEDSYRKVYPASQEAIKLFKQGYDFEDAINKACKDYKIIQRHRKNVERIFVDEAKEE